jgi:hypothetical protein
LRAAAWGLELIAGIGEAFGARPEALRWLPASPPLALALMLGAMTWAAVWRGRLRWLGLPAAAAAVVLAVMAPTPALLIDGEARAVLARTAQGWRLWRADRGGRFAAERLAQRAGLDPERLSAIAPLPCAEGACRWRSPRGAEGVLLLETGAGQAFQARLGKAVVESAALATLGGADVRETREGLRVRHALEGAQPIWRRRLSQPERGESGA